jgi:hypothetical protein
VTGLGSDMIGKCGTLLGLAVGNALGNGEFQPNGGHEMSEKASQL